tara:strand:+ start:494 stop:1090 length:597 start_codon:yes stop_codon:yes gene_type:complete
MFNIYLNYIYNNIFAILLAILFVFLLLYNTTDYYIFIIIIFSYFVVIAKILLEAIKLFKTQFDNIPTIYYNTIIILKEYLPFALGSSLVIFYIIFNIITKLRIDLAIASNCKKRNKLVEINTIRNKINTFAYENNDKLKRYLILFLVNNIVALVVILNLIYYNNVEIYYIYLIPILILNIIFASVNINRLTTETVSKL